jgi:DNA modification methylase
MTAIVMQGNAASLQLPDASVDLIVTSPPYFGLRSYQDGGEHLPGQVGAEDTPGKYLDALLECTAEWLRVLKPSGSLFVNLGDKYTGGNSGQPRLAAWSAERARGARTPRRRPSAAAAACQACPQNP